MKRVVSLGLVGALSIAAPAMAAVPGFNATCPNHIDVHADDGGPIYIDGREARVRTFNDNYYEAKGGDITLSVSRTSTGAVNVTYTDRDGGSGMCRVASATPSRSYGRDRDAGDVTCESQGHQKTECEMDTRGDVRLVRQLSKTRCVQGSNWGLSRHSIWVQGGCRGVFRNTSRN